MKKFLTQLLELLYQFLFAVSSAVVGAIVFSWPLLLLFTLLEKTYQTVNLTVGQVMSNYNQLLLYLLWPGKHQLKMSDLPTSASAASHFAEVKSLFVLAEIFFLLALAVSFYFSQRKKPLRLSQTQALVLMLLPVAVMPFALSDFDSFFRIFHTFFFHNNNWLFDPATDPVINVLTEGFFAACFAVGGVIYELFLARYLLRRR